MAEVVNFKGGIEEGEWKAYHETGKLKSLGQYKKGKEEGKWKFFHENGKLQSSGNFKDGIEDGGWKYYDINGKAIVSDDKISDWDAINKSLKQQQSGQN